MHAAGRELPFPFFHRHVFESENNKFEVEVIDPTEDYVALMRRVRRTLNKSRARSMPYIRLRLFVLAAYTLLLAISSRSSIWTPSVPCLLATI